MQDVFVVQTQGCKRWRVFRPPPPSRMPRADPLARGKIKDTLELTELEPPLIDTVLRPGHVLYVPAGFPHATDTKWTECEGISDDVRLQEPSVHLTLGVDTHVWGLTYASLRDFAYRRSGIDGIVLTKLKDDLYWRFQSPLPIGFLSKEGQLISPESGSAQAALQTVVINELVNLLKESEPTRWTPSQSVDEIASTLKLGEVVERLFRHHFQLLDIFRQMYSDVAFQLTPTKMNLSIFRNQKYFPLLESTMERLHAWANQQDRK